MVWAYGSRSERQLTTGIVRSRARGYPAHKSCYATAMTIILRLFTWGLAAAIAFATLGPAEQRPHSTLGQNGEHALAFVLLGLAFGLAHTRNRLHTAAFVIAFTGLIEVLQFLAPGRHARLEDFVVDALAAGLGIALAAGIEWAIKLVRRPTTGTS
jgi:VanZ family protein